MTFLLLLFFIYNFGWLFPIIIPQISIDNYHSMGLNPRQEKKMANPILLNIEMITDWNGLLRSLKIHDNPHKKRVWDELNKWKKDGADKDQDADTR